jgi:hypothetical protein
MRYDTNGSSDLLKNTETESVFYKNIERILCKFFEMSERGPFPALKRLRAFFAKRPRSN